MSNNFDPRTIQADFDRIALLPGKNWDHNSHYLISNTTNLYSRVTRGPGKKASVVALFNRVEEDCNFVKRREKQQSTSRRE